MATILLVDDTGAVLNLAATILERAGHRVVRASNGLQALQVYQSYAAQIDVVITDLEMPEMGGLELAARIRATHPSARVLLMTAGPPRLPTTYPLVLKPFRSDTLVRAVQDALGGHAG